jgi:hypothetical protein
MKTKHWPIIKPGDTEKVIVFTVPRGTHGIGDLAVLINRELGEGVRESFIKDGEDYTDIDYRIEQGGFEILGDLNDPQVGDVVVIHAEKDFGELGVVRESRGLSLVKAQELGTVEIAGRKVRLRFLPSAPKLGGCMGSVRPSIALYCDTCGQTVQRIPIDIPLSDYEKEKQ